jgi:lipoate-protein ligase A
VYPQKQSDVSLHTPLFYKHRGIECLAQWQPEVLAPGSHTVRAVPSVKSEVTNVCRHLQQPPDMRRFLRLLFHYFLSENGENPIYRFTRNDIEAIERLKREKYATEAWIWGN